MTDKPSQQALQTEFKQLTKRCRELKKKIVGVGPLQSQEDSRREHVPEDFKFTIFMQEGILFSFTSELLKFYPDSFMRETISYNSVGALPYKGILELVDPDDSSHTHTIWVTDHHKSSKGYFSFYTKAHYTALQDEIAAKNKALLPPPSNDISLYRFVKMQWKSFGQCSDHSKSGLVGYSHYLDQIKKQIGIHVKNLPLLTSIGESRSLNYALQGPPGVGKTTLIKTLASHLKLPVCIVNPTEVTANIISVVLNPYLSNEATKKPILVVFEDFDRFLMGKEENGLSVMSQILNALDGFEDKSNMIRFFTANNADVISKCEALSNRMSRTFVFDYPKRDDFEKKFDFLHKHLTPGECRTDERENFLSLVSRIPHLTLRPFTTYAVRYMLEPDYLGDGSDYMKLLLDNIEQLGVPA